MKHSHNSFNDILLQSSTLKGLLEKAENLSKLNRAVLKKLDPALRAHCRVTNFRDGILILTTPSPAFGHNLRFSEIELLTTLRREPEWAGLKSVQTRVRPEEPSPTSTSGALLKPFFKIPKLSAVQSVEIKNIATQIASEKLKRSLLKLASTGFPPARE